MTSYYVNEAVFEVPFAEFRDRSVTLLEAKLESGNELSVGIQRGEYDAGQTLSQFIDDHVSRASRALRSYGLIARVSREVRGFAGCDVTCRWRNGKEMVYTHQTFIDLRTGWMLVSTNGKLSDREAVESCSEHVVSTLRFRD